MLNISNENYRVLLDEQAELLLSVRVSLNVSMGEVKMSIDQLLDLVPGHEIEFHFNPERPLTLSLEGEKVGEALLFTRDNQLGLKIISVSGLEASEVQKSGDNIL